MAGLLDYFTGGASGINRGLLSAVDSTVGNPMAGLLNTLGADIQSNPVLRTAQQFGVGRDAINPQQAIAQQWAEMPGKMLGQSVPIGGDIAGLYEDKKAYESGQLDPSFGNFAMSALGLVPGIPGVMAMTRGIDTPEAPRLRPEHKSLEGDPFITDAQPISTTLYHGSQDVSADTIRRAQGGSSTGLSDAEIATFATSSPKHASQFVHQKGGGVVPVSVNMKKPALIDAANLGFNEKQWTLWLDSLKGQGYDGAVFTNFKTPDGVVDIYASFDDLPVAKGSK